MSYCRMVDGSDVYVWGSFDCLNCNSVDEFFNTRNYTEMIAHLKRLRFEGKNIPQFAINRLLQERRDNGEIY